MEKLSKIHVKSFNFLLRDGLKRMVKYLPPVEFSTPNGDECQLHVEFLELSKPCRDDKKEVPMYPHECRRQGTTYGARLCLHVRLSVNGTATGIIEVPCGDIPIMVLSRACRLSGLKRSEFPKHCEEERDLGGYFIVNGKERVLRLIIMTRRNFPLTVSRPSFRRRGHGYTDQAVIMRCVRDDETTTVMMLHWLMNSEPTLAFVLEREQFFIPISILLRALVNKTEFEIFDDIRRGSGESLSLEETAMRILMRLKDEDYSSQSRALAYLGRLFRLRMHVLKAMSDEDAGIYLLKNYVAIHLDSLVDKYHLLW
ncbi:unnamed protein product [Calicophoron daubneyi]|uniref:DNA-directed RNA polymerase n=1 Tax=Calicophoron daubneyi TaxID=300641 RepID=A0AAV2TQ37_CALDB